jgi:hypothetical protein
MCRGFGAGRPALVDAGSGFAAIRPTRFARLWAPPAVLVNYLGSFRRTGGTYRLDSPPAPALTVSTRGWYPTYRLDSPGRSRRYVDSGAASRDGRCGSARRVETVRGIGVREQTELGASDTLSGPGTRYFVTQGPRWCPKDPLRERCVPGSPLSRSSRVALESAVAEREDQVSYCGDRARVGAGQMALGVAGGQAGRGELRGQTGITVAVVGGCRPQYGGISTRRSTRRRNGVPDGLESGLVDIKPVTQEGGAPETRHGCRRGAVGWGM